MNTEFKLQKGFLLGSAHIPIYFLVCLLFVMYRADTLSLYLGLLLCISVYTVFLYKKPAYKKPG